MFNAGHITEERMEKEKKVVEKKEVKNGIFFIFLLKKTCKSFGVSLKFIVPSQENPSGTHAPTGFIFNSKIPLDTWRIL